MSVIDIVNVATFTFVILALADCNFGDILKQLQIQVHSSASVANFRAILVLIWTRTADKWNVGQVQGAGCKGVF